MHYKIKKNYEHNKCININFGYSVNIQTSSTVTFKTSTGNNFKKLNNALPEI